MAAVAPSFAQLLHTRQHPLVMGIVNATPDSFSGDGHRADTQAAVKHALALAGAGADCLDIGGESTRPGARPVGEAEEMDRVLPVIEALAARTPVPLSIDTRKPAVARAAVCAGASLWNDVSALRGAADAPDLAARLNTPVVLMHMQGKPGTMQRAPHYEDAVAEVIAFLQQRIKAALQAGVRKSNILVDPGIGFGKRLEDNLALLAAIPRLMHETGCAVLIGASRKRFIEKLDAGAGTDQRLGGSLAALLWAAQAGAALVRVHDVRQSVQALAVWRAISGAGA